jgi:hypothetical protein
MAQLHGNSGLILDASGELSSDRYGLWTGRCRFRFPPKKWELLPAGLAPHPHAPWALAEKQTVSFTPGLWTLTVEYAGTPVESSEPVYESRRGTGQEPIETHPKFVSHIAGTPSSPLNGALFVDEEGLPTADNQRGIFRGFRLIVDGGRNPYAGLNAYLAVNNTIWSKSWTQKKKPSQSAVGKISSPDGPQPGYPGGVNWISLGVDYTLRGGAFACNAQWLGSGPGGWNDVVYGT